MSWNERRKMSRPVAQKKGKEKGEKKAPYPSMHSVRSKISLTSNLLSQCCCQRSQLHQTGLTTNPVKTQVLGNHLQDPKPLLWKTRAMGIPEAKGSYIGKWEIPYTKGSGGKKKERRVYAVYKGSCSGKRHCDFRKRAKCWYASALVKIHQQNPKEEIGRIVTRIIRAHPRIRRSWRATLRIWMRTRHKK